MKALFFIFMVFCFPAASLCNSLPDSVGMKEEGGKTFILHKVDPGQGWYAIARKYGVSLKELRDANPGTGETLKAGQIVRVPYKNRLDSTAVSPAIKTDSAAVHETKVIPPPDPVPAPQQDSAVFHIVTSGETLFSLARKYRTSVDKIKKWNNLGERGIKVGEKLRVAKGAASAEPAALPPPPKRDTVVVDITHKEKKTGEKNTGKKSAYNGPLKEVKEPGMASLEESDEISHNKFFALHRTLPAGTIIRVTDSTSGKMVYVKVVGPIPDTEENKGFVLKMSRLAVMKLDSVETKFKVELSYGVPLK